MTDAEIRRNLLLSIQGALLFAVPPTLRAVTCGWHGTEVQLRFLFDGPISEDDEESARIVGSEVVAAFPAPWTIDDEIKRLDYPADLKAEALPFWVFARKEQTINGAALY